MSEYATVWVDDLPDLNRGEEIVRCRDCKHMFDWAYDRPMCKLWAMNDPDNSNASYGNALYPVVKPDGYCAWGERKEGE